MFSTVQCIRCTRHHETDLSVRLALPRLRIRRWKTFGDSRPARWAGLPLPKGTTSDVGWLICWRLQRIPLSGNPLPLPADPSLRLLRIWLKPDPSTAASGSVFVRARARARTNTPGWSFDQTLVTDSLGWGLSLSGQSPPSLIGNCAHDSLLIWHAVTNWWSPLRGDHQFARHVRIVTPQKLRYPYQDISAVNWPRGGQQSAQAPTPPLRKSINHKS